MDRKEKLVRTRLVELNENGEVVKEKLVWKPESEAYAYKVEGKPERRQFDCGSASRPGGIKTGCAHSSKARKMSFANFCRKLQGIWTKTLQSIMKCQS